MKYVDLTLPSPAANLACDEALLDACDSGTEDEVLRFWEAPSPFVVIGYANATRREVNLSECTAHNVPVLRRLSGGGTVLQGPGCLNYSLILKIPQSGPLATIVGTNRFIRERLQAALQALLDAPVTLEGDTDLAIGGLKFSGNAQRRKRHALIFHGTSLLAFDIAMIERYLPMPSKQPGYRGDRGHAQFLTNLGLPTTKMKLAIRNEWRANEQLTSLPMEQIELLASSKYSTDAWNLKF